MLKQRMTKFLPHVTAIVVMVAINVIYFFPQFQGKVMSRPDAVQSYNMRGEFHEFEKMKGEHQPYYWNNSMFGGMPDKLLTLGRDYNVLGNVIPATRFFIEPPTGVFLASMIVCYLSLLLLGMGPWISLIGALLFGLNTNHMILWETGHALKNFTIVFFPAIFAGLLMVLDRRYLPGGLLFALGVSLSIYSNHPQMFYYMMMSSGLFFILYALISLITKKATAPDLLKMSGILAAGLLLGMLSNISQVKSTLNYGDVTMRGEPILKNNKDADPSSKVKGLDWEYSMGWSNGPKDVMSTFIPRAAGGGGTEEVGPKSMSYKFLKEIGQKQEKDGTYLVPLYHGGLPFTSGPIYIGVLVMFLFVTSLFVLPRNYGIALGAMGLFIALVSMGKNTPSLNKFLFEYLPYYNKFRAPTSIFHGVGILFVIPGIVLLKEIVETPPSWKKLLPPLVITAGTCLVLGLFSSTLIDFTHPSDAAYGQEVADIFHQDRLSTFKADAYRSFFLIALAFLAILGFVSNKVIKQRGVLLLVIGLLGLLDLWSIGRRYLDSKDWVKAREHEQKFAPRKVDKQIKKMEPKGRGYYRVHDLSVNSFNNASTSYHHNTIGGYSAAKMQRIEDMIDRYIEKGDMNTFNMLNAKYFITPEKQIQVNQSALGNAWFVSALEYAQSADEEIRMVGELDVAKEAVVLKDEFTDIVDKVTVGDATGSINLVEYEPGFLKYDVSTTGDQVAVFSEVWYPDSWEVSIDGQPAEMFRVNYLLRALAIPNGAKEVVFAFQPKPQMSFVSLIASLIILGALGFLIYQWFNSLKHENEEEIALDNQ